MTRHVGPTEQGRLQGLDGSLRGMADLVGPGLFTLTFAYFIAPGRDTPGAPFLLASLLQAAAIALAWRAVRSAPGRPGHSSTRGQ
jgi:MFS transporter, DHA1 family, tetracycline resistance protein